MSWTPPTYPVINFTPTLKQQLALKFLTDETTDEILYGGSAGGGKSFLGSFWLLMNCLKYNDSRWLMGRSELKTLKETTLVTFFQVCRKYKIIGNGYHYNYNQQSNSIKFYNDSEILLKDLALKPSDPEFATLGGLEIAGAFIDEIAEVSPKAREILKSRFGKRYDDGSEIKSKLFMTSNPCKNFAYSEFYKPFKDGTLPDNLKFIHALPTDNKHLSHNRLKQLMNLKGIDYKRLFLGEWEYDSDDNALIKYNKIHDIFTNKLDNIKESFITCDPARLGRDKCVIIIWNGLNAHTILSFAKTTVKEIVDKILELEKKYNVQRSNIIIDSDGVGGGVVDYLKGSVAFQNGSKPLKKENFTNLKSQCYYKLAEYINTNQLSVNHNIDMTIKTHLIEELEQVKAKDISTDGKKALVPKEDIKNNIGRSPDYSDCLMFRMFYEIKKGNSSTIFDFFII